MEVSVYKLNVVTFADVSQFDEIKTNTILISRI